MLETLLSGGATGLIGSAISNIVDIFKERQQQKFELEKRRLDIEQIDKEQQFQLEQTTIEKEAEIEGAEMDLIEKSYEHDAARYSAGLKIKNTWLKASLIIVDIIRGLVRPVMTAVMLYVLWETRLEVKGVLDAAGVQGLDVDQALNIYQSLVDAIVYLALTAGFWWFGTRPMKKKKI